MRTLHRLARVRLGLVLTFTAALVLTALLAAVSVGPADIGVSEIISMLTRALRRIVDPIALGDALQAINPLLADPGVVKIFHAAEFDLMLLKKELGAEVRGLFDTQVAMTLLRHDKTGLAALIQSYYGVELSKTPRSGRR